MEVIDLYTHGFRVHVPNLLGESIDNAMRPKDREALRIPLTIFKRYLYSIAQRCAEINDPILNRYMLELAIYSEGDPESPDYDIEAVNEAIRAAKRYTEQRSTPGKKLP